MKKTGKAVALMTALAVTGALLGGCAGGTADSKTEAGQTEAGKTEAGKGAEDSAKTEAAGGNAAEGTVKEGPLLRHRRRDHSRSIRCGKCAGKPGSRGLSSDRAWPEPFAGSGIRKNRCGERSEGEPVKLQINKADNKSI